MTAEWESLIRFLHVLLTAFMSNGIVLLGMGSCRGPSMFLLVIEFGGAGATTRFLGYRRIGECHSVSPLSAARFHVSRRGLAWNGLPTWDPPCSSRILTSVAPGSAFEVWAKTESGLDLDLDSVWS